MNKHRIERSAPLAHRRPGPPGSSRRSSSGESGYVLMLTALILPALLLMASFAVDLGAWYVRGAELQRGADAAALAGVVWMPNDFATAVTEAKAASARNGLVDGVDGISVVVTKVANEPQRLQVDITDNDVDSQFGKVVLDHISMTRSATARYVLSVPLGSPLNNFGNSGYPSNDTVTNTHPQFWAAINAPYTDRNDGDPYATKCDDAKNQTACNTANAEYRKGGYLYAIDVPASQVGKVLKVEVFDAPYNRSAAYNSGQMGEGYTNFAVTAGPAISYELFAADNTPLNNSDNPSTAGTCTSGTGRHVSLATTSTPNPNTTWANVCTITLTKSGVFPFRVKSSDNSGQTDQGNGSTHYAIRATSTGTVQPSVYALNDMSIFTGGSYFTTTATSTNFYLAQIDPIYAGKSLEVDLYDPGDGTSGTFYVSILKPDGTVANCSFTNPAGTVGSVGACKIKTRDGALSGAAANVYNGKWLRIFIDLPTTYTCTTGNCWWKVKYEFTAGADPYDRTVWTASLSGDPVGLVK